jgi:hypothetical protein
MISLMTSSKTLTRDEGAIDRVLHGLVLELYKAKLIQVRAIPQFSTDEMIYTASVDKKRMLDHLTKETPYEVHHQTNRESEIFEEGRQDLQGYRPGDQDEQGFSDLSLASRWHEDCKNHKDKQVPDRSPLDSGAADGTRDAPNDEPIRGD